MAIALAARETTRIAFGTGVATPAPQVAGYLAGATTTLQQAFPGRVVLGLGRGDRAAASFGLAPMPVEIFERYVARVQGYLRGDELEFDPAFDGGGRFPPSDGTEAGALTSSALAMFLAPTDSVPKVPLEVFASGPRVIGIGARHADRLMFAVGAEPQRVGWAMATAREAMAESRRDPGAVTFGAMVTVCPGADRAAARDLVRSGVASMARFSSMQGRVAGDVSDADRAIYEGVSAHHTEAARFASDAPHVRVASDEFVDRFAVIGSVEECVDRLADLVDAGVVRFALGFPSVTRRTIVEEVLPALRARCGVAR